MPYEQLEGRNEEKSKGEGKFIFLYGNPEKKAITPETSGVVSACSEGTRGGE